MKTIYALVCPVSKEINYVGLSGNPERRYEQHMRDTKDSGKTRWLKALKELNLTPMMIYLSTVPDDADAAFEEARWITFGLERGWPLKNEAIPDSDMFDLPMRSARADIFNVPYRYEFPDRLTMQHKRRWWWRFVPPSFVRGDAMQVAYHTEDDKVFYIYYLKEQTRMDAFGCAVTYSQPSLTLVWGDMHPDKRDRRPVLETINWPHKIKFRSFDEYAFEDEAVYSLPDERLGTDITHGRA